MAGKAGKSYILAYFSGLAGKLYLFGPALARSYEIPGVIILNVS
jgi:hypothetical protein